MLAGDTVRWSNDSVRVHTVTAVDGSWASPRIVVNDSYSHEFDTPGTVAYYCSLHPVMRGEVDVHNVLLAAPSEPGAPGRPYVFHGRSALPAGSAREHRGRLRGRASSRPATPPWRADGTFTTEVVPTTSATYRAVVGAESSPAVQLLVLDRKLAVTARRPRPPAQVSARVAPASHGAPVVLQLRLPQHFGWWPVARAKLDHASMARFSLRLRHRYPARVVLTLRDGATALAVSRTLHVGPR